MKTWFVWPTVAGAFLFAVPFLPLAGCAEDEQPHQGVVVA